MVRIRLIHWKEEECAERAAVLEKLGYQVDFSVLQSASMKEFRENPPDVVVIDLGRLPAHGLEVGTFLRGSKSTRLIPLVFVGGIAEKVQRVKDALPDARFTTYEKIGPVLEDVLAGGPVREAVVPAARPAAPLGKKLGVKEAGVRLVNGPDGFENLLPGVLFGGKAGLTLWFVGSLAEYKKALQGIRARAEEGGVWVIWPKTRPGVKPDINGNLVRELALEVGLVDFKICAVDEVWSGMRFAVRKT
jgi:CheY-like chemotaxis protein